MRPMTRVLTLILTTSASIPSAVLSQGAETPEAQVRSVAQAFSDALARGDSTAALALLHEDVLIFEGRTETKEQYRRGHLAADIRFAMSAQRERLRDGVTIMGESALYTSQKRTTGTNSRGAPIDRTDTEAMVLVRTPAGWRIRSIHWF
jgi:ketosteroid isomerase-like protein